MSWDRKKRGPSTGYVYLSVRDGDRVRKVYYGRSVAGGEAAAAVERNKRLRREARETLQADQAAAAEADRLSAELYDWASALAAVWLALSGHHFHRGDWRRGRMPKSKSAKKPRVGSRAWELTLDQDPVFVANTAKALVLHARDGTPEHVEMLLEYVDRHPEVKGLVPAMRDLTATVEEAWVERLSGSDKVARKALEDELAGLKAELLGPAPDTLDRLLAEAVVVARMSFASAAKAAAQPAQDTRVRAAREKRLSVAQARYIAALREWRLIAGKKAKGLRPAGSLKVFDPAAG